MTIYSNNRKYEYKQIYNYWNNHNLKNICFSNYDCLFNRIEFKYF